MGSLLWLEAFISSSTVWLLTTSIKLIPVLVAVLLLRRYAGMSLSLPMRQLIGVTLLIALIMPFGWRLQTPFPVNTLFSPVPVTIFSQVPVTMGHSLGDNSYMGVALEHAASGGLRSDEPQTIAPKDDSTFYSAFFIDNISIISVFGGIWFLGFVITVALVLRSFLCLAGVKRRSVDAAQITLNIFAACGDAINLRKLVKLRVSGEVGSPMVVGWLKPIVLLPKTAELLSVDQLRHILLHELTHVKRGDVVFCWFVTGVVLLHWFNPLVWLLAKCIRADMEMACDRDALSYMHETERTDYGKTLIELAGTASVHRLNVGAVGVLDNHKELSSRIKFIARQGRLSFVTIISSAFLFFASVAVALSQPTVLSSPQDVGSSSAMDVSNLTDVEAIKTFIEKRLKRKIIIKETHKKVFLELNAAYASEGNAELLESLFSLGFSAYDLGDATYVEKLKFMRNAPIPFYDSSAEYSDYQFITAIIPANNTCLKNFVELRRIIPSYSHVAWSGDQILVSTYYKNLLEVISKVDSLGCRG